MNSIQLIGRLTKDPEVRETNVGNKLTKLRLAVPRRGQGQPAIFIDVAVYGHQAEPVATYMTKGRQVAVSGRLEFSEWERDGVLHTRYEVVAHDVTFLGTPPGAASSQGQHDGALAAGDESPFGDEPQVDVA